MDTSLGVPWVRVPVLSKANTRTRPNISRKAPPLIKTPCFAADVIALIIVTGVDISNAHGHAITNIVSARYNQPCPSELLKKGSPKNNGGTTAIINATPTTAGV